MAIDKEQLLTGLFHSWSGEKPAGITALPQSGSYREYYRIKSQNKTALGVYNSDKKENTAFISFTNHFKSVGLNVPAILAEDRDNDVYLLEDLGDTTLFAHLSEKRKSGEFTEDLVGTYKKVLDKLPLFQVRAAAGLDYSVCYPRAAFDRQSMMWDLNYFKYYFLKLAKIPFDEQALEADFQAFCDYLLKTNCDFFLYRDFQSRNIMLVDGEPYFIDYQGGRKGALQYDLASLLYDAKADIPQNIRRELLLYYISVLKNYHPVNEKSFIDLFYGYVLIRIMQAMGAYGFRGFYEKKEHFLKSIPFAVANLEWLLNNIALPVKIPALLDVLSKLVHSKELKKYSAETKFTYHLKLSVNSFSYRKGLPNDKSGNGGGFVFDCRAVHNPGRYDEYRLLTGKDTEIIKFLESQEDTEAFFKNVVSIVEQSVDVYLKRRFTDLMVNFGCTGGQHRSVYFAERLAKHFKNRDDIVVDLHHIAQEEILSRQ